MMKQKADHIREWAAARELVSRAQSLGSVKVLSREDRQILERYLGLGQWSKYSPGEIIKWYTGADEKIRRSITDALKKLRNSKSSAEDIINESEPIDRKIKTTPIEISQRLSGRSRRRNVDRRSRREPDLEPDDPEELVSPILRREFLPGRWWLALTKVQLAAWKALLYEPMTLRLSEIAGRLDGSIPMASLRDHILNSLESILCLLFYDLEGVSLEPAESQFLSYIQEVSGKKSAYVCGEWLIHQLVGYPSRLASLNLLYLANEFISRHRERFSPATASLVVKAQEKRTGIKE